MCGSSNFDFFSRWEVGGRTAGDLWGVASGTYSKLLAVFLCSYPVYRICITITIALKIMTYDHIQQNQRQLIVLMKKFNFLGSISYFLSCLN